VDSIATLRGDTCATLACVLFGPTGSAAPMLVSDFFRRSTFFRPWWQGSRSRRQRRLHAGPTESAPEIVKFFSQLLIILGGKNELFSNQQLTFFRPIPWSNVRPGKIFRW
jgi:hypothetical protein